MKFPRAIINTSALLNNINIIRNLAPNSKVLAIVKANAYGHGLTAVARTIHSKVDGFGVARIDEAEKLRTAGINNDILLLEGFVGAVELLKLNELNLNTVIHCFKQLELIEAYSHVLKDLTLWIKFNTGMNRLGFDEDEVLEVKARLDKLSCIKEVKLMSHLQRADDSNEHIFTESQISKLNNLNQAELKSQASIAASAGILFYKEGHVDWVRPGIIMYGISPNYSSITEYGFKPVMTLETCLISIHKRVPGDTIGYSATYVVENNTYIGVVALGYGDGYPRNAPSGTPVLINGRICPIVGRVSMDMLTVDLGPNATDNIGDTVTIFGDFLPVEDVAKHLNIITYELTTSLTERVKYTYLIDGTTT